MNGERYPGESLPFEPSMRHADRQMIAKIERYTYSCMSGRTKPKCAITVFWQNEAKMLNLFNAWRVLPNSGTAQMTLRLPNRETARFFDLSAPRPATALDRIAQVVGDDRVVAVAGLRQICRLDHRVACDLQAPSRDVAERAACRSSVTLAGTAAGSITAVPPVSCSSAPKADAIIRVDADSRVRPRVPQSLSRPAIKRPNVCRNAVLVTVRDHGGPRALASSPQKLFAAL